MISQSQRKPKIITHFRNLNSTPVWGILVYKVCLVYIEHLIFFESLILHQFNIYHIQIFTQFMLQAYSVYNIKPVVCLLK